MTSFKVMSDSFAALLTDHTDYTDALLRRFAQVELPAYIRSSVLSLQLLAQIRLFSEES